MFHFIRLVQLMLKPYILVFIKNFTIETNPLKELLFLLLFFMTKNQFKKA